MESYLIALFEETETFLETFFPFVPRGITCAPYECPPPSPPFRKCPGTRHRVFYDRGEIVGRMEGTSRLVKPILGVS